jgi:two-component system, OmpR family, phosphate regulon response regulator OmpR
LNENSYAQPHILVVDDDKRLRELLKIYLSSNGYLVSAASTAAEARRRQEGISFDLIVLDIMMPGESGLDFARSIRNERNAVPILMLSALAETQDKIAGLSTGSDDYLSKPFEPQELLLRIKNILRRVTPPSLLLQEVQFGPCVFNIARGELRRSGELVRLTSKEKELLRLLAQSPGQPLSRTELAQAGSEDTARSVDVQVNRLRQKIEKEPSDPQWIQTVRGAGYVLLANPG